MKKLKKLSAILLSLTMLMTSSVFSFTAFAKETTYNLRVEGTNSTIINLKVNADGQNLTTHLKKALDDNNIPYDLPQESWGSSLKSINNITPVYPVYWHLYNNNEFSQVGLDGVIPEANDNVVIFVGDDHIVQYPSFTFTPTDAKVGDDVTVNVRANYFDADNNYAPATKNISGVLLKNDYSSVVTDENGNATLTVPATGKLVFSATKEEKGNDFAIVRMPEVAMSAKVTSEANDISTVKFNDKSLNTISGKASQFKDIDVTDYNGALVSALCSLGASPDELIKAVETNTSTTSATTLSGQILALTALGKNATDINGKNLIDELASKETVGATGLNGYVYALIALDSYDYKLPQNSKFTRDDLINGILSFQKPNGGFALSETYGTDVDMTAMALCALAKYKDTGDSSLRSVNNVKPAIQAGLNFLSMMQTENGGYSPTYTTYEASESVSQVIIALSTLGIDANKALNFTKNGRTLLDALASFETADGYSHIHDGRTDMFATSQAIQALSAYKLFKEGKGSIYDIKNLSIPLNDTASEDKKSDTSVSTDTAREKNPGTNDTTGVLVALPVALTSLIVLEVLRKKKNK